MRIQLNKICFGLPARAFSIDYTVSQKRQLPVVKEFIVRLLHSMTLATVETLQNYFGFSDAEMRAVLDDLIEESLILWEDDKIKLSNYAMTNFVEVDGHMLPRFFEVTDKIDTVHFDLHSFKMLPKTITRSGAGDLGVSMTLSNDCYKGLNDKAQRAFDNNFQHFREVVLGDDIFSERQELYKINNVATKYDIVIPIDVEYVIDTSAPTELLTEYESTEFDEWDSSRALFTAMDNSIPRELNKGATEDFSKYLEASEDPILSKYWDDKSKKLKYDVLVNHFEEGVAHQSKDTQLIIGNFYSDFNSDSIIQRLKDIYKSKPSSSGLLWFTDSDSNTWGRTNAIRGFISALCSVFDKRKKTSEAVLVMSCESKQEAFELHKIYRTLDANLLDCSKRFGGNSAEILLIPNIMVACLYHAPFGDDRNITFPVGYISFDQKIIEAVTDNAVTWSDVDGHFNNYFERNLSDEKSSVLNKFFTPIITQHSG
jgi:hypothetical protein